MEEQLITFDFESGRQIAGRYTILEKLGSGYEGEVYKVSEAQTNMVRALQVILPSQKSEI